MGILEKIAEIEREISRTQKNKGTNSMFELINSACFLFKASFLLKP